MLVLHPALVAACARRRLRQGDEVEITAEVFDIDDPAHIEAGAVVFYEAVRIA